MLAVHPPRGTFFILFGREGSNPLYLRELFRQNIEIYERYRGRLAKVNYMCKNPGKALQVVLISLALIIMTCFNLFGSSPMPDQYYVEHFTDENGLPQNSVKNLAADPEGFIWITTENGLVRFDGRHFFTYNKSNTALAGTPWFYDFQPDPIHRKSTFYANGDRVVMRIENGIAVKDSLSAGSEMSLPYMNLPYHQRHIASGGPNVYISSSGKDFLHYLILCRSGKGRFYVVHNQKVEYFENKKISWTLKDKCTGQNNYFGHQDGLYRVGTGRSIEKLEATGTTSMALSGEILNDGDYLDKKQRLLLYWNHLSDQAFLLLHNNFYLLRLDGKGGWTTKKILSGFDFHGHNIHTVHYNPSDGRLLLGSLIKGLFVITPKDFMTLNAVGTADDNVMYAQALFGQRQILSANGLLINTLPTNLSNTEALPVLRNIPTGDRRALVIDHQKNIWTKYFNILYKFDPTGNRMLQSWDMGQEIKTIYQAPNGRIWFSVGSKGLYYLDPGQNTPFRPRIPPIESIHFLTEGPAGTLWAGTFRGLYRIELASGKAFLIPGTASLYVRSIYLSPTTGGGVFFTTYENGFYYYKNGKLTQFPLDEQKNLSAAHCIVEDRNGFFWIPTNKGLFQFSRKDLVRFANADHQSGSTPPPFFLYYAKRNGFLTNEFDGGCQPCSLRLPDGRVSLPSMNGFVLFKPEDIATDLPDKIILVDRYTIQDKLSMLGGDTVNLPLSPEQIKIYITTPYFGNAENIRMSYSLHPVGSSSDSDGWIPISTNDPVIFFSKIDSGDYTLTIRKQNGFGPDNQQIKRLLISVPKHWYETGTFKLTLLIALILTIYLYNSLRTRKLIKTNRELEQKIEARTQNLQDTLNALQVSEKELGRQMYIQTRLVASISHDVRTPMKYVVAGAEQIASHIGNDERYGRATDTAVSIGLTAKHMGKTLDDMVAYIKTQFYGSHIGMQPVNLHQLLEEKTITLTGAIADHGNALVNMVPQNVQVNSNPHLLGIIVHNLIDNANKWTVNGEIRVLYQKGEVNACLAIEDTGQGMPAALLERINEAPGATATNAKQDDIGSNGLGLLIVKEIATILHIGLSAENVGGAKVSLTFPNT